MGITFNVQKLKKYLKMLLICILAFFAINIGYKVYKSIFGFYVVAKFSELGPIYKAMPVYYKGYKVGTTSKLRPSDDYKYTLVKLVFKDTMDGLPLNITAKVKKLEDGEKNYISLEYPDKPSAEFLKRGSVIEGKTAADLNSFMSAQAESGSLTIISDNAGKALESVQKTSDKMGNMVDDLREILKENRASLKAASEGLAATTQNIADLTSSLDNAVEQQTVKNIVENLEGATQNIEYITENINKASKDLDQTMAKVDSAVCDIKNTTANVSDITSGVKHTMSKRFGTTRLLFGTPVKASPSCALPCTPPCAEK